MTVANGRVLEAWEAGPPVDLADDFEHTDDHAPRGRRRDLHDEDAWRDRLVTKTVLGRRGEPDREVVIANLANAVTILSNHPAWKGCVAYDLFANRPTTTRPPPWTAVDAPPEVTRGELSETDVARFLLWFYRAEGLTIPDRLVMQAVSVVAEMNPVHPVRDYLRSLRWDAKQRLPSAAATYFGTDPSEYASEIVPRWFVSAVARVENPGAQCDCVLILEGRTGFRKSTAFRSLVPVPEWYADSGIVIGSKDSYQNLHGVWIYGFDELDSLNKSELTATKNFITQTADRYRPSYGRVAQSFRRQNVFCGTTNKDDYLNDPTGDRRYWPLRVVRPIEVDAIVRDRDQLWAEAVARYDSGERWHVDSPHLRRLCEAEQRQRTADDAWAPLVAEWLRNPTVRDPRDGLPKPLNVGAGVTTTDVLVGALGMRPADIQRVHETRAGVVLRQLGLSHVSRDARDTDGARPRRYRRPSDEERRSDDEGWPASTMRDRT